MSRHPDYSRHQFPGVKVQGDCYGGLPKEYARYKQHGLPYGVPTLETDQYRSWFAMADYTMYAPDVINDGDTVRVTVQVRDRTSNGNQSTEQQVITYEFDKTPDGVTPGNVAVDISAALDAGDVAAAFLTALLANSDQPAARFWLLPTAPDGDVIRMQAQPCVQVAVQNIVGTAIDTTDTKALWQNDTFCQNIGGRLVFLSFSIGAAPGAQPAVPFRGRPSYRAGG